MQNTEQLNTTASPFSLNNKSSEDLYKRWRDKKLASHPQNIADLLVEVKDPRSLSSNE
ncbi:MAG: hypothetical protein HOD55_05185, partial [Candidatus Thioglobus sp.]|nr:hypothetical protein [Candidatus Thioglobus sp.]